MTIRWSSDAEDDLLGILRYWTENNHSASYALRVQTEVDHAVALLTQFPELGEWDHTRTWRSILLVHHFRLIYTQQGDELHILRFWDTRQDPGLLTP